MSGAGPSSSTGPYSYSDPEGKWEIEITLSALEIQCKYIIIDEEVYQIYIRPFLKPAEVDALPRPQEVKVILYHRGGRRNYEMYLRKMQSSVAGEHMYILAPWLDDYENDLFQHLGLGKGAKLGLTADACSKKCFQFQEI